MDRAMHLGLELPPLAAGEGAGKGRSVIDAALFAEQAGIGAVWLTESVPVGLDPVPIAGALAACTTTIGIGLRFRPGFGRHPSLITRDAIAVDLLSHGRALVALVEDGGGPLDLARLGEAVVLIGRLFREGEVTEAGRFYGVAELTVRPRPFHPGGPPVVAGVLTEPPGRASVEQVVARAGAAAHVVSCPPDRLNAARRRLDAVASAGARPQLLWRGELPADATSARATVESVLGTGADGLIAVVAGGGSDPPGKLAPVLDVLAPFAGR